MPPNLAILALAARRMFAKRIDFREGVVEDADTIHERKPSRLEIPRRSRSVVHGWYLDRRG